MATFQISWQRAITLTNTNHQNRVAAAINACVGAQSVAKTTLTDGSLQGALTAAEVTRDAASQVLLTRTWRLSLRPMLTPANRRRTTTLDSSSYFSRMLLHRRKLAEHLLRLSEIGRILLRESACSPHLLKHPEFFRSRPLQIAHQGHRDTLALRLLPFPQHGTSPNTALLEHHGISHGIPAWDVPIHLLRCPFLRFCQSSLGCFSNRLSFHKLISRLLERLFCSLL